MTEQLLPTNGPMAVPAPTEVKVTSVSVTKATPAQNGTSDLLIPLLIVIIIIIFFALMIYLLVKSTRDAPGNILTGNQDIIQCGISNCAVNLLTGFKRCPEPTQSINANPRFEVCNQPFACDNPLTPFALQSDGSTNLQGICQNGIQCPCKRQMQCADYITSLFQAQGGNPYAPLPTQRIIFPQTNVFADPVQAIINPSAQTLSNQTPIINPDPATNFCTVPIDWLYNAVPGCPYIAKPAKDSIAFCMGMPNNCNGVIANPCLVGTLAFIPQSANNFSTSQINTTPLGCVRGTPCACGQVAVWDKELGMIRCSTLT
jgi:hypothetical protein